MGLSGSQPALMPARVGLMRLGASRVGYYQPTLTMTINGVARSAQAPEGLTITDISDGTPNTATMRVRGFTPVKGHEVRIGLGGLGRGQLIFAGHILTTTQVYVVGSGNIQWDIFCISYEWLLNRRTVTGKFTATSATDIVTWIMTHTSGFTTTGLETGLSTIDEITFTNVEVGDALDRVATRIGGRWIIDYAKDLHFGVTITPWSSAVQPITTAAPKSMEGITQAADLSQVRSRLTVSGGGSVSLAAAVPGDTLLPVEDPTWYASGGGTVEVGPQHVTYTGVDAGGDGAIIGTGVLAPTNALTSVRALGAELTPGAYEYKTTYVTASGETLTGPASIALTVGGAIATPSAPSAVKAFGGNLSAGDYQWKVTYVDSSGGETAASTASSVVTMDDVAAPGNNGNISRVIGGSLPNETWLYKYTFTDGSVETTGSPANGLSTGAFDPGKDTIIIQHTPNGAEDVEDPPSGLVRQWYRSINAGTNYYKMTGAVEGFQSSDGTYFYHSADQFTSSVEIPTSNSAVYRQATVTIPVSSDANVASRKLYRTEAGGSTFKLVATIANNTATSYGDNVADGSLGATAPTVSTTVYLRSSLTDIPISPDPAVTERNVYRTEANGSTFKLLTNLANNTTTTYADSTADASLGATEPGSDTSGLTAGEGTVNAGSSTLPISSSTPFNSGGGWARIQSQIIRYTGTTATSLTGIPAIGATGALASTVRYGGEVLAAPTLTGIPASGAGSILYAIPQGEAVYIYVERNDTAAQTAMAGFVGGDGIHVEHIADHRLSQTEAENRGDARLEEVKDPLVTVRYQTRDMTTRSGRDVTITLDAPTSISGTFRIQRVTLSDFAGGHSRPLRTVEASSRRLSFEAILRAIKAT